MGQHFYIFQLFRNLVVFSSLPSQLFALFASLVAISSTPSTRNDSIVFGQKTNTFRICLSSGPPQKTTMFFVQSTPLIAD